MSYLWERVAGSLKRRSDIASSVQADLGRILSEFYGPLTAPVSPRPVCLFLGARSGLEIEFVKANYPGARIITWDCKIDVAQCGDIAVNNVDELMLSLQRLGVDGVDFCRVDEHYFTDELITELGSVKIKIDYLCGAFGSLCRSPYQLHRDLSCVADLFYVRSLSSEMSLAKSVKGLQKYVSVIVPAYGIENYLPKCLETLSSQTLKEIEIIVVDDGAKDNSGAIADDWASRYPEIIKVIHKENGGCASARNAGLAEASGYYVGFVDGDDWVSPYMFEDLLNAVLPGFKDIGQCGYVEAYESGGSKTNFGNEPIRLPLIFPYETNFKPDFIFNSPSIWRRIYRRDFLNKYDLRFNNSLKRFDDLPFAYLALSLAQSVVVIPDAHYFYRMGRPGQDVSFDDERLYIHFEIFDYLYQVIETKYDGELLNHLGPIEAATHRWALSLIREDLKDDYRERMLSGRNLEQKS